MTARASFALGLAAGSLLALGAAIAGAQSADSARVKAVKVVTDSQRAETCRGGTLLANGTCSGRKLAPRTTVVYRLANRVDSIEQASLAQTPAPPPPPPPAKPVAAYSFACANGVCQMDGRASTGRIAEYKWRASDTWRPLKYTPTIDRTYSATSQPWTEWLIVTDSAGLTDSIGKLITWSMPTPPPPDTTTPPPTGSPAELPRVWLQFPYPTPTRSVSVPAGANLQTALDNAQRGDELVLAAGATFTGNFTASSCGAGWITIRSAGTIPAGRMRPSLASTLAKVVTPNTAPAFATTGSSCRWRLVGFEVTVIPTLTAQQYGLVTLLGSEIVLDRMYVHGQATTQLSRCVALNSRSSEIAESWLGECHGKGFDSQAIWGGQGAGPYRIANNHLEGAGENVMFGGQDPTTFGLVPSDIEIRGNYFYTPLAWRGVWTKKTLFESKNASRVLIEGNVFDGSWADAQEGNAFVMKSGNQSGGCRWCRTTDITIRRNLIRNAGGGIGIGPRDDNPNTDTTARRILVSENVLEGIGVGTYGQPSASGYTASLRGFQVLGGVADVTLERNVLSGSFTAALLLDPQMGGALRSVFRNNVWTYGIYGVIASGWGPGTLSLEHGAPGYTWSNQTLISPAQSGYPAGTVWVSAESAAPLAATIRSTVTQATAFAVVPP